MSNLGDASVVLIHRAFSRETTTALVTMAMLELATTTPTSVSCPTIVHCQHINVLPIGMIATITATLTGRPTITAGLVTPSTHLPVVMYTSLMTPRSKRFCEYASLQTVERFLSLLRSKPLAVMVVSGTLRLSFRFRCQCR